MTRSKIFFLILASAADAASVKPNSMKALLANGLITISLMVVLLLIMDQDIYEKILLIIILNNWVFDNLISVNYLQKLYEELQLVY